MTKRVDISTERSLALRDALGGLPTEREDVERLLDAAGRIVAATVPPQGADALLGMRDGQSREPALLLKGVIPVDADLPPTPRSVEEDVAPRTPIARAALLGLARVLGEPVGYRAEKRGALVHEVFPVPSEETAPSNESSTRALDLHTEIAFSRERPELLLDDYSPDFLVLSCLRGATDRAAGTVLVSSRDVCRRISSHHLGVLREPRFELQAPYSFTRDGDGSRPWVGPASLVTGDDDDPLLHLDLACGTRGRDPGAEEALDALRDAAGDPSLRSIVSLKAGDALVIDNRRSLHGRTAFTPNYDGRDRWLQRVYVRRSLLTHDAPGERRLPTRIL